jgi:hypothetical protein
MTQPAAPATYRVQTGAIQWYDAADGLHAYGYNAEITAAEAGPDFLRLVAATALVPVNAADLAPALDAFYGQFDHAPDAGAEASVADPAEAELRAEAVRSFKAAIEDNPHLTDKTRAELRALDPVDLENIAAVAFIEHPTTRLSEADLPAEASTAGSSARPSVADEA